MVVFNESNVIGAKIYKLTSIIGNLSTQNRWSKPFKLRVYQSRGCPLTYLGIGDQYNKNINRNRFCDKAGHMIEIEVIIGTIRILEAGMEQL